MAKMPLIIRATSALALCAAAAGLATLTPSRANAKPAQQEPMLKGIVGISFNINGDKIGLSGIDLKPDTRLKVNGKAVRFGDLTAQQQKQLSAAVGAIHISHGTGVDVTGFCTVDGVGLSASQTLKIGSPAPALTVSKWVKGKAVTAFVKGKIYVVEFWATWCYPCKTSIPHLTAMQKANPDVQFIGVSVLENDQKLVAPFVAQMADKMAYTVAMDKVSAGGSGVTGSMVKNWMTAAGQDGIPTAFIVDKHGDVVWIGHPMGGLDTALAQVKDGTFDVKAEAAKSEPAAISKDKMEGIAAAAKSSPKEGLAEIDKVGAKYPQVKPQLANMRYNLLLASDETAAYGYGRELLTGDWKNNAMALNELSWNIVDNGGKLKSPDYDLALAAAERANELTKSGNEAILDTLAYAQYKKGDKVKALANQKKAIALLKANNASAADMKGYEDHLALYMK